jgi:MYXO-CTERM domain-containing protein
LHPTDRFEAANYPNVYPPTNVNVDPSVKERMGDFYASVHDALLAKNPKGILNEYAWPTIKHCGEPCPNAPLKINELLTLGGDVLEEDVSDADKNPKPADFTDAEKEQMKTADRATRARMEEQRKEVARRQALLARNSYVITRLHHRYDAQTLTADIELKSAGPVKGGVGVPAGPSAEAPSAVEPAKENRLQIRYNVGYPNKKVVQCEAPQRWRWGIPPASYRGLRKIFTARDLAYKKRDRFPLNDVIKSSVPVLGIAAAPPPAEEAAAPAKAATEQKPAAKESGCALSAVPARSSPGAATGLLALLAGVLIRRRRTLRD